MGLTHLISAEIITAAQLFSRQQTPWHISWGYISRVFAFISSPGAAPFAHTALMSGQDKTRQEHAAATAAYAAGIL
jgi:hypothetical protein